MKSVNPWLSLSLGTALPEFGREPTRQCARGTPGIRCFPSPVVESAQPSTTLWRDTPGIQIRLLLCSEFQARGLKEDGELLLRGNPALMGGSRQLLRRDGVVLYDRSGKQRIARRMIRSDKDSETTLDEVTSPSNRFVANGRFDCHHIVDTYWSEGRFHSWGEPLSILGDLLPVHASDPERHVGN